VEALQQEMKELSVKSPSRPSRIQHGKSVLIVEDEFLIRWSLRSRLRLEGFDVTEAIDVASARSVLNATMDLVLLDVRLPDGDGLELLYEFRLRWPPAQIIVMTAHGTRATEEQALAGGAFALVHKPFDLDEVVRLTHRATAS
jgi:DNA-binding NtrC family response regulator